MRIKTLFALATLLIPQFTHAAYITIDEPGMDRVFSQPSFGSNKIDIRIGSATELISPQLLNLSTDAAVSELFSRHVGGENIVNFYFVDTIAACGGMFSASIIGCGQVFGNNFAVESDWAADTTIPFGGVISYGVQVLAHELGHNLGLLHRYGDDLMSPFINGYMDLDADEVSQILMSPLVQLDQGQRYIQIDPVLVSAVAYAVPEPSTLALMLFGLLIALGRRSDKPRLSC